MNCLIINGNNLHLKMYAKVEITKQKLTKANTIDCDVKYYQVKTTMVSFTDVWLKWLKILTSHRRYFWSIWNVCGANNKI